MDVALAWNGTNGDIAVAGADLLADDGLATAVIISLCSDGRAGAEDLLPGGQAAANFARRGWWAAEASGWGSLPWLLAREKTTAQTAARARDYAANALRWLVDDGIAAAVEVTAEILDQGRIGVAVAISRGANRKYDYLWRAMENTEAYTARLTLQA